MRNRLQVMFALIAVCLSLRPIPSSAALPDPKTGGPDGAPVSVLVIHDGHGGHAVVSGAEGIDGAYAAELKSAGYRLETVSFDMLLSKDYLRQFGVVILTRLPFAGEQYSVGGERLAPLAANLKLVQEYVNDGGGLVFLPAMSEFGEAYADVYNRFLAPYDIRYVAQQLKHKSETDGVYAAGRIAGGHEISAGLSDLLYPVNVLRWDHAYSTTPFLAGKGWTTLAAGKPGSGTHQAIDNAQVGEQLTAHNALFAVRPVGKGWLACSAIHSYYTLTHAFSKEDHLGENNTGKIDGIVVRGEADGRPSHFGKLMDRTMRFFASQSAQDGIGGGIVALPEQPPAPETSRTIDWHATQPPPTWKHRVIRTWHEKAAYYDEHPDPAIPGDVQHFKALIGPRTSLGGGSGTVRQYRDAAIKAGYNVIVFCEPLESLDPTKWDYLVADCRANSDADFVCLPGLDLKDFQGGHYLVIGAERFPDPSWLTPDGKRLEAVRMLSLGWYGHCASVHRSGRSALHPKMYKHYQGITVFTYDGAGKLVDEALHTYQWAVRSDSNPFPIVAHELDSPNQVTRAASTGFQQILPGADLATAVDYFRFAFAHYFDCPGRYYISEGPVLNGWSIRNKDIGPASEHRDHYRLGIGITNDLPLTEVTLFDGFEVAGRWRPNTPSFHADVDGFHDRQREYMLLARDTKGRRVLSPGIRTVTRNWRLRCGDRQNWLGSMYIYTGWYLPGFGGYSVPIRHTREGGTSWLGDGGGNPCPIFDFPFFSNHAQVMDVDLTTKYVDTHWEKIGGDAKPTYSVRPTDFTDGALQTTYFVPKQRDFAVAMATVTIRLKRDVEPDLKGPLYPTVAAAKGENNLLLLPGKPAAKLSRIVANRRQQEGDKANRTVDLPIGAYAGGIVPLTGGLRLHERSIGFPAPPADTLTLHEGTSWSASYLVLKGSPFHWRQVQKGYEVDAVAEQALTQMGFRGRPPYTFVLKQGKADPPAYIVDCTADQGGIAGTLRNDKNVALLYHVPLRIAGLNPRCDSAVWRSDRSVLDYFACFRGRGMVTFDADKTVDFYAGNVATCDPALFVSTVVWNETEAWFRVNNPTSREIKTDFATVAAIRGFKPLKQSITVRAGTSMDIRTGTD